jgi:putative transposase
VKPPEHIGLDLSHLTEKKRREAYRRLDIIKRWEQTLAARLGLAITEAIATSRFIATVEARDGVPLSRSALYEWRAKYRQGGLAALADSRGGKHEDTVMPADDRFFELIKTLWLNVRKPTLASCYQIGQYEADRQGWPTASYRTIHRRIDSIPQGVVDKLRNGEEEFIRNSMPYNERDYSGLHSNEMWCGDHHQMDVIVNAGGKLVRPWLTAWQDMRSRKIVGWRLFDHSPNSDTIILAMKDATSACGVPREVYIENGRDYDCYALNGRTKKDRFNKTKVRVEYDAGVLGGLFGSLGVDVTHCQPYHGQSKPIERFFGTLESQFGKLWPTYCGRATHEKPENLQLQLERGNAPTLEAFTEAFTQYLATFHAAVHQGDGMNGRSPDQVYAAEWGDHAKRTTTEEMLWFLTMWQSKPVDCGQNGVLYQGIRYGANNPSLWKHKGTKVTLRADPARVNEVIVCDLAGRPICIAQANSRLPVKATAEELKAAQRANARDKKAVKDYHGARPRMALDLVDRTILARAEENKRQAAENPQPTPTPPAIQPVRSPFEPDIAALRRAFDDEPLRMAVGAESMSFGELGDKLANSQQPEDAGSDPFADLNAAFGRRDHE